MNCRWKLLGGRLNYYLVYGSTMSFVITDEFIELFRRNINDFVRPVHFVFKLIFCQFSNKSFLLGGDRHKEIFFTDFKVLFARCIFVIRLNDKFTWFGP